MSRLKQKLTPAIITTFGITVILIGIFAPRHKPVEGDLISRLVIPTILIPDVEENDDSPPEPNPDERVTFKGRVVGPDGKPIVGTKLFVQTKEMFIPVPESVIGEDGSFTFDLDMNDRSNFCVLATAPNHGISWHSLYRRPPEEIQLQLPPDEPIRGTLLDPEGKPVSGVTVSLREIYHPYANQIIDEWLRITRDPKLVKESSNLNSMGWRSYDFSDIIPPVISDRDGKFELRGVGRDRVADLRISSPTVAPLRVEIITRKLEPFMTTVKGLSVTFEKTYYGSEFVLTTTLVPITKGRVLDKVTGQAIPGAMLWVQGRTEVQVVADQEGKFTLPGLTLGEKSEKIRVIPPDDAPYHRLEIRVPDAAIERGNFDVHLTRGIPATVKVVDKATKKPVVANLTYNAFLDENANIATVPDLWFQSEWHDTRTRSTQDASEFRIVVFPGKGLLVAKAQWKEDYLTGVGAEKFLKRITKADRRPYYSGARLTGLSGGYHSDIPIALHNQFSAIDVPEDTKEFSITLELDPGLSLVGEVVDPDGKPLVGVKAYGLNPDRDSTGWTWTKPSKESAFTVSVLGPHEKRRVLFVHHKRKLAGSILVTAEMKEPIRVQLEPWGEATGQLVDRDGTAHEFEPNTKPRVGGDPVGISKAYINPKFWFPIQTGVVGPEGHFRMVGLIPGLTYSLEANDGYIIGGTWHVGEVTPKSGETINLGKVGLR